MHTIDEENFNALPFFSTANHFHLLTDRLLRRCTIKEIDSEIVVLFILFIHTTPSMSIAAVVGFIISPTSL